MYFPAFSIRAKLLYIYSQPITTKIRNLTPDVDNRNLQNNIVKRTDLWKVIM
jgi:hypothetical protein